MNTNCLEKVVEYASMPLHGTLSRKLRKDLKTQINEGRVSEKSVLFLGTDFLRVTEQEDGMSVNTSSGWEEIASIRTYSSEPDE